MKVNEKNVLGTALEPCCFDPMTGYYRDGYCSTDTSDLGRHVVCAVVTEEFLKFSRERGNDLVTPRPELGFPGLQPGNAWCLCVQRWLEAQRHDSAPKLKLRACHENALKHAPLELLQRFAVADA